MVRMEPCLESLLPDFSSYSPVQSGRPAGYCVPETHGYHTGFSGQDLGGQVSLPWLETNRLELMP